MQSTTLFSKSFTLVAAGQIISLFGNQILRYVLPLYLLYQTGSSALFGSIMAVSFIPMLLLFPVGGIIADRVNKRNIMVVLDFATALLILGFTLLAGRVGIVVLMGITMLLLYGIQGAYQPAVKASVPVLVPADRLMQANSVVDLISSLAGLAGPVIGGLLFSALGLFPILALSVACFFVSAVMELFIHMPFEKREAGGNIIATGFADLKESFLFLFRTQPVLWKVSCVFALVGLLLTPLVLIGLPVLITQHLGFAADTASRLYGYAQSGIAAGAILGGILAGALAKRLTTRLSPFIMGGCALSMLLAGLALQLLHSPLAVYLVVVLGCALLMALSTLFQIQILSSIQVLTPGGLIGKVISCVTCLCMCTSPVGQFVYGLVFQRIGSRVYLPFYAAALLMLVVVLCTRRVFHGLEAALQQTGRA